MLTALYRHFDSDDVLLYVGISLSPTYRLSAHRHSGWASKIARVTIEWLPTREAALEAERVAIQSELPRHNVVHRVAHPIAPPTRPVEPAKPEWVDSPEKVAAYFSISLAMVKRMLRDGMPCEQISARKFRFDLTACKAWCRANAETSRRAAQEGAERRAAQDLEAMRQALERAFPSPGDRVQ